MKYILMNKNTPILSCTLKTDGWLKKRWKIINGERCLIKAGSGVFRQGPLLEPYSVCENFVTPDTELVTAWQIYQTKKKPNHVSAYDYYLQCCAEFWRNSKCGKSKLGKTGSHF